MLSTSPEMSYISSCQESFLILGGKEVENVDRGICIEQVFKVLDKGR